MTTTPRTLGRALAGAAVALAAVLAMAAAPGAQAPVAATTTAPAVSASDAARALQIAAQAYFPGDDDAMSPRRIFRLSRDQIDATVKSLLPAYVTQSIKAAMAKDPLQTNYEYAELLSFNAANVGALTGWIGEIASRVRMSPAGVVDCPAKAAAVDCLEAQARKFVVKAFRGDVGEAQLAGIVKFYLAGVQSVGFEQATGDLVEVVLNSPSFLFRREIDLDKSRRLAPAQLLQALTYTMADAPPERLKLESGSAGQHLRRSDDARATIDTILASGEAREKLVRFFTAWLELKEADEFTISPAVYPEFNAGLAAAMREETMRFLRAQLSRPAPTLKDITRSIDAFVSKPLEPIYGIRAAEPSGAKAVKVDPAQRLGIFSQAAVLASHSGPTGTRPIKRGVFWVRKVMCMELEPPPKDLHAKIYDLPGSTERQRIEQSTQGAACAGCHKIINPFGFFLEKYDALGRWRTLDGGYPIDASISVDFLDEGQTEATGPVEALKAFTGSMMFKQCFVRQLFRFYMGRSEEPSDDPLLRSMFITFVDDDRQDILKLVEMLASSDSLVRRQ